MNSHCIKCSVCYKLGLSLDGFAFSIMKESIVIFQPSIYRIAVTRKLHIEKEEHGGRVGSEVALSKFHLCIVCCKILKVSVFEQKPTRDLESVVLVFLNIVLLCFFCYSILCVLSVRNRFLEQDIMKRKVWPTVKRTTIR
jgi:uncharacterized protein with PQ loop repeat